MIHHFCITFMAWTTLLYCNILLVPASTGEFCGFRENHIRSVALSCVHTTRRGYPSHEGAHIAISEFKDLVAYLTSVVFFLHPFGKKTSSCIATLLVMSHNNVIFSHVHVHVGWMVLWIRDYTSAYMYSMFGGWNLFHCFIRNYSTISRETWRIECTRIYW